MILYEVNELIININKQRQDLYELASELDLSNPKMIQASQQLDKEIFSLQKIISKDIVEKDRKFFIDSTTNHLSIKLR